MSAAPLAVPRGRRGRNLCALQAQRLIGGLALRLSPAVAAGMIGYSHLGSVGDGLVVFVSMMAASQLVERSDLPMHLMPASRVVLGLAAPALGGVIAWTIVGAAGGGDPLSEYVAIVLGAWLVMGLGAWIKARLTEGVRARAVVVGSREFAAELAAELAANSVEIYEVVGWLGHRGPSQSGLRWFGGLDSVRSTMLSERLDLLICAPWTTDSEGRSPEDVFARVADQCVDLPVRMIAAHQLYEETLGHVPLATIDTAWYRYIMHPNFRAVSPLSKRLFDLVVGTAIALTWLPVLALAALAVKLGDRGPVFYRQRRLGEHGQAFDMIKLRTMRIDAEPDGPRWAEADDPRVTRIGRLLRRTHVDEIPQLWNVLCGEMTLVGPRPERPEIVAELEGKFPHYTRRQLVKPGIAGWAALRCGYAGSEVGAAWKLCHDLFYVKRRSLLADTLILAETVVEVFRDAHRALRTPGERFLIGEEPNPNG